MFLEMANIEAGIEQGKPPAASPSAGDTKTA